MNIRVEHEIHTRRRTRNVGVGLMLAAFVILIMVLTFVKITQTDFVAAAKASNSTNAIEAAD